MTALSEHTEVQKVRGRSMTDDTRGETTKSG